jgi:hypothetical protein
VKDNGEYEIVGGLQISPEIQVGIDLSGKELEKERATVSML